jgi:hypothetical protein
MKAQVEVLDCGFDDLAGKTYKDATLLCLEADMSTFSDSDGNVIGMLSRSHIQFGAESLFVNATIVRGGNLEKIRLNVSNFGV